MQEGSKTGVIAAILAVVIVVGGIGAWALWGNSSDDTAKSETSQSQMAEETKPSQNIVEVASANPDFSTLVTAIKTAGLVDTLSGPGPFTVFAPTNEAFDKLPAGTLDNLLNNPDELKKVLTYHVVSGEVKAADVVKLSEAETVNGKKVSITVNGDKVMVGDAMVTKTDIMTSNGVIHVIDTVLVP